MPQYSQSWSLQGEAKDFGKYYLVELSTDPRKFISIGTNGCLTKRKLVLKNAKADPIHHYPIDVLYDVALKGHNKFIFVKNSIIHLTHSRGFLEFLRRRYKFVVQYHFQEHDRRRWSVVVPGDNFRVLLYVFYSLTLVGPVLSALRGYLKINDVAWFVHPFMCFATTLIYGYVTIRFAIKRWM
jgi:hypothetical protein